MIKSFNAKSFHIVVILGVEKWGMQFWKKARRFSSALQIIESMSADTNISFGPESTVDAIALVSINQLNRLLKCH